MRVQNLDTPLSNPAPQPRCSRHMGGSRIEQWQQLDIRRNIRTYRFCDLRAADQVQPKLLAVQSPQQCQDMLLRAPPDGGIGELHQRDWTVVHAPVLARWV